MQAFPLGCLKSPAHTEQLISGYVRQGLCGEGILKSNDISMLPTGEASTTLFSLQEPACLFSSPTPTQRKLEDAFVY